MAEPRQEVRERWATGRWIGSPQLGAAVTAQLRGVVAAWEIVEPRSAADFGDAVPDVVVDATAIDPHDGGPVPSPAISSLHRLVAVVSEAWCGVGASPDVAARQGAVVSRQRALALACAASGPTVNTIVVPDGFPATARSPRAILHADIAPADLAHVLAYFLDPANGYVLGQMVSLCGGARTRGVGMDSETPLDGRVAVVTGAGRGIGAGIASVLAGAGAHVVVNDLDADAAAEQTSTILASGGSAEAWVGDVSDPHVSEQLAHRRVDILVNNAGIGHDPTPVTELRPADVELRWRVNLRAPLWFSRAVVGQVTERRWGRIVMIGSRSWLGASGQADYAALKAGVVGLTRSLALELAPTGVTVNAVVPGSIVTPALEALPASTRAALLARHPAQRFGTAADIGRAVLAFATPGGRGMTGQVLHVCGGRSLYGGPVEALRSDP